MQLAYRSTTIPTATGGKQRCAVNCSYFQTISHLSSYTWPGDDLDALLVLEKAVRLEGFSIYLSALCCTTMNPRHDYSVAATTAVAQPNERPLNTKGSRKGLIHSPSMLNNRHRAVTQTKLIFTPSVHRNRNLITPPQFPGANTSVKQQTTHKRTGHQKGNQPSRAHLCNSPPTVGPHVKKNQNRALVGGQQDKKIKSHISFVFPGQ